MRVLRKHQYEEETLELLEKLKILSQELNNLKLGAWSDFGEGYNKAIDRTTNSINELIEEYENNI